MKSVLLIGLGRFGKHMAMKFTELNNEVLAVDSDAKLVNDVLPYIGSALVGDSTNEQFIASLGVPGFDLCVVAMGKDFQSSLETTSLLKEYGAKYVLARASRDVHAKFLLRNGADSVVYAEKEMAHRLALTYSIDHILNYLDLTPDVSIYEIETPSSWIGKSILEKAVQTTHNINILATMKDGRIFPLPKPEHLFTDEETLLIIGENEEIRKLND